MGVGAAGGSTEACFLVQVIAGGHYDVDCSVEDPQGRSLYHGTKKQYDSFTHRAELAGVHQFCFSNEFSTFSHKTVYFDFQVGDEPPILPDMGSRVTALTQVSVTMSWTCHWVSATNSLGEVGVGCHTGRCGLEAPDIH